MNQNKFSKTAKFSLGLLCAASLASAANAGTVTASVPAFTGTTSPGTIATFNYTIPAGQSITGADLQLDKTFIAYADSGGNSFANFYLNGDLLGEYQTGVSGSDLSIPVPSGDLSSLTGGSADLSFQIPPGEYFAGDPGVLLLNGGTLTIDTTASAAPEDPSLIVDAGMLLPLLAGGVRMMRKQKSA